MDDGARRPEYVDACRRALIAQVALALNPLSLVATCCLALGLPVLEEVTGTPPISTLLLSQVSFVVAMLLMLATAVAFFAWLQRARSNAHALTGEPPAHGSAFAIAVWLIPCANCWLPLTVVREVDRKSDPTRGGSPWLLGGWWVAYLAMHFAIGRLATAVDRRAMGLWFFAWVASALVAATLAILVIRRIQKNQIALVTRADAHAIAAEFA
ncbi:DUF4328 domain-containing protein [Sandaracinus amylolyticus]|nr:DUF4328 domain-containing protein [Sandaracinus amylolyticus]